MFNHAPINIKPTSSKFKRISQLQYQSLIGWVREIRNEQHELFKTAILESAVDFNSIEEVFVIIPSKSDSEAAVD